MEEKVIDGIVIPNMFGDRKKLRKQMKEVKQERALAKKEEVKQERDHYDLFDKAIRLASGGLLLVAFLVFAMIPFMPKTEMKHYMYETKITSVDYHKPYYRKVGKVTRFFPAEYWVCFAYETHTFCGNNKTIFDRNQFDGVVNIIVSVDVETQVKDGKFVGFHNVRIIEDTDN